MRGWLKVIGAIGVLLIATLVAGVVALKSMDFNRFKTDLDQIVQDVTGREFTIAGDLDLAISLNPTLSVTDVTFANADWGRAVPMMKLERLDARVALRPLLSGRLEVDYIVLNGMELVLQTDGKGKANWEFDMAAQGTGVQDQIERDALALDPHVRDVRLRNVHVTYIDGATGGVIQTELKRADFSADSLDSPLKGVAVASYNGVDFETDAVLGSLGQLIAKEGEAFPVHLKIAAPGISAEITGSVEQPSKGMAVDARLVAEAQNTQTLSKLAGVELPDLSPVNVRANVSGGGTVFSLKGLDVKAGNSDFQGSADLNLAGNRPRVVAKLSSQILYAKEFVNVTGAPSTADERPKSLFTSDPLPFEALNAVDADVHYLAKRVTAEPLRLTDVRADMKLNAGKLSLNPVRATVDGGRVSARVVINGTAKTPNVSVRASFRGVDAGMISALAGQGRIVTLGLDGEVNVKGAGTTTQQLMGSLNGTTSVVGRNGEIHDKLFADLTEGIGSILPWASNKDANAITCMIAKMPVKNGVATAETVILDTSGVLVNVTGNIDLGGELLHLTVHTDAKSASLASFAVPVRVKGSFVAPRIDVDPGEAVVGTVGNIVKVPAELIGGLLKDTISLVETDAEKKAAAEKNDPCLQALRGGKTTQKAKTTPKAAAKPASTPEPKEMPTKPVDPSKSSGDPKKDLETLGKALKKLF